ncbi:hypothetical protein E2C01_015784 [Portunus trituberculatus]|uniref:Uncharacterized protein n=1 Tax=Portunus trituberculatus TaxID=210409 RepID=A0A5B7DMS0_PORTR|nr:hypothetical protein [Portunus trituberculatus]
MTQSSAEKPALACPTLISLQSHRITYGAHYNSLTQTDSVLSAFRGDLRTGWRRGEEEEKTSRLKVRSQPPRRGSSGHRTTTIITHYHPHQQTKPYHTIPHNPHTTNTTTTTITR